MSAEILGEMVIPQSGLTDRCTKQQAGRVFELCQKLPLHHLSLPILREASYTLNPLPTWELVMTNIS